QRQAGAEAGGDADQHPPIEKCLAPGFARRGGLDMRSALYVVAAGEDRLVCGNGGRRGHGAIVAADVRMLTPVVRVNATRRCFMLTRDEIDRSQAAQTDWEARARACGPRERRGPEQRIAASQEKRRSRRLCTS